MTPHVDPLRLATSSGPRATRECSTHVRAMRAPAGAALAAHDPSALFSLLALTPVPAPLLDDLSAERRAPSRKRPLALRRIAGAAALAAPRRRRRGLSSSRSFRGYATPRAIGRGIRRGSPCPAARRRRGRIRPRRVPGDRPHRRRDADRHGLQRRLEAVRRAALAILLAAALVAGRSVAAADAPPRPRRPVSARAYEVKFKSLADAAELVSPLLTPQGTRHAPAAPEDADGPGPRLGSRPRRLAPRELRRGAAQRRDRDEPLSRHRSPRAGGRARSSRRRR